jgi:hypothetical protein
MPRIHFPPVPPRTLCQHCCWPRRPDGGPAIAFAQRSRNRPEPGAAQARARRAGQRRAGHHHPLAQAPRSRKRATAARSPRSKSTAAAATTHEAEQPPGNALPGSVTATIRAPQWKVGEFDLSGKRKAAKRRPANAPTGRRTAAASPKPARRAAACKASTAAFDAAAGSPNQSSFLNDGSFYPGHTGRPVTQWIKQFPLGKALALKGIERHRKQ